MENSNSNNYFILKTKSIKRCCFCDEIIHHVKKTKRSKVFICTCGAKFIKWREK